MKFKTKFKQKPVVTVRHKVTVEFTAKEKKQIDKAAKKLGITPAQYVREVYRDAA